MLFQFSTNFVHTYFWLADIRPTQRNPHSLVKTRQLCDSLADKPAKSGRNCMNYWHCSEQIPTAGKLGCPPRPLKSNA